MDLVLWKHNLRKKNCTHEAFIEFERVESFRTKRITKNKKTEAFNTLKKKVWKSKSS